MNNSKSSTYHFIGVGGIGMSGLAELLVRQGCRVSGSDLADGAITRRLADPGGRASTWATGPKTWATPTSWSTPPR